VTPLAVITDADACVPRSLRAALGIHVAPADPALLLEPETIPQLRVEATEVAAESVVEACRGAVEGGASEVLYLPTGDGHGSPADLESLPDGIGVPVTVEATGAALMGAGWQAIAAAEAIRDGGGTAEAIAAARAVRAGIQVLAMLEHPELASAAGNAELGIVRHRALVALRGREVSVISRPPKRDDALAMLRDRFAATVREPSRTHVAVQHAAAGPGAEALARWIERELSPARLVVAPLTRHAATRLGPRMLALAWYEAAE
jgi:fatty acid-binding protein DegV